MLKLLNTGITGEAFTSSYPYDMAAKSSDTLPSGCPIMTTLFVVDKIAVAFSDGEDNWYRNPDTPVAAGKAVSELF
jgi:hypothetical protein